MQYPFSVTDTNITVFIGGKPYTVPSTHTGFNCLKNHLKNEQHDYDYILGLVDQKTMITKESGGRVSIVGDSVFYNGQPAHGAVVDKLLAMRDEGFPIKPWVLFMEKLMANPNEESRQSLYNFLEHFSTPITPDGDFLAFKRVRDNFMDIYSGTFDHTPGKVVEMDRDLVDSDSSRTCSSGLHACASNYLGHFYSTSPGYKVVVVKINPTDVCAVPNDYEFSKMRVCRYEVLSEAEESDIETISASQFSTFGQPELVDSEKVEPLYPDALVKPFYGDGWAGREEYFIVNSDDGDTYLHKDGTWHGYCGEKNFWDSREEAQSHLEKYNVKTAKSPLDEYTDMIDDLYDDELYYSSYGDYYNSYDSY